MPPTQHNNFTKKGRKFESRGFTVTMNRALSRAIQAVALMVMLMYLVADSEIIMRSTSRTVSECVLICEQTGPCQGITFDDQVQQCELRDGVDPSLQWFLHPGPEDSGGWRHFSKVENRCPLEWTPQYTNDMCYLYVKTDTTWELARTGCSDLGGALVEFQDEGGQAFIDIVNRYRNFWVGAVYSEGIYSWLSGGNTSINSVLPSTTDDDPDSCIVYRFLTRRLKHRPCSTPYFFICQRPMA